MQKIPVSIDEKLAALRANSYFSTLSDIVLQSLAPGTTLRLYEREVICWQDDLCTALYIISTAA
jgi:hypothetical protein